jgi:hypothetical protein
MMQTLSTARDTPLVQVYKLLTNEEIGRLVADVRAAQARIGNRPVKDKKTVRHNASDFKRIEAIVLAATQAAVRAQRALASPSDTGAPRPGLFPSRWSWSIVTAVCSVAPYPLLRSLCACPSHVLFSHDIAVHRESCYVYESRNRCVHAQGS